MTLCKHPSSSLASSILLQTVHHPLACAFVVLSPPPLCRTDCKPACWYPSTAETGTPKRPTCWGVVTRVGCQTPRVIVNPGCDTTLSSTRGRAQPPAVSLRGPVWAQAHTPVTRQQRQAGLRITLGGALPKAVWASGAGQYQGRRATSSGASPRCVDVLGLLLRHQDANS